MNEDSRIIVNGEARPWREALDIQALVEELGLAGKRIAVEVNGEIVPRSRHAGYQVSAQDRVEIVQAIGGG